MGGEGAGSWEGKWVMGGTVQCVSVGGGGGGCSWEGACGGGGE